MSLKNRFVAFAVALATLGAIVLASQLGQNASVLASAVWGS
jgi:hypothetical protein